MSQGATVAQVKARILAIAGLCSGITTASESPSTKWPAWTDAQLSAVIVRLAGTTARERLSPGGVVRVTRRYSVIRYVQKLAAETAQAEKAAIDAAEAVLDVLPAHFLKYPTLDLTPGERYVFTTGAMTDTGAMLSPYGGVYYSTITYTLPVVTLEAF